MIRIFLFAIVLLAPCSARAQPSAAANAALAPSHRAALREFIDHVGLVDVQLAHFQAEKIPPLRAEMAHHFFNAATRDKAILLAVPVLGRHLNEREALDLAASLRPAPVRVALKYWWEKKAGKRPAVPALAKLESAKVNAAMDSPAYKRYEQVLPAFTKDLRQAWSDWIFAHQQEIEARTLKAMAKAFADLRAASEADPGRAIPIDIPIDMVGISYFDKINRIFVETGSIVSGAAYRFDTATKKSGLDQVLVPVNLIDHAGVARGKAVLDLNDALLETYLREVDDAQKRCEIDLRAVIMPDRETFMKSVDASLLNSLSYLFKFGENQRHVLELHRRLLALAEAKSDTLQIENGKLLFATDADLTLAQSIVADLRASLAAGEDLAKKRRQSLDAMHATQ